MALKEEKPRPIPEREQAEGYSADRGRIRSWVSLFPDQQIILSSIALKMKTSGLFCTRKKKKEGLRSYSHASHKLHSEGTITYINDFLLHHNCHCNMTVLQPLSSVFFVVFLNRSPRKKNQTGSEPENKPHNTRRPECPFRTAPPEKSQRKCHEWCLLGLSPLSPALLPELCGVPANRVSF